MSVSSFTETEEYKIFFKKKFAYFVCNAVLNILLSLLVTYAVC
jgi:fluoride ion exporter CrcB/FEX